MYNIKHTCSGYCMSTELYYRRPFKFIQSKTSYIDIVLYIFELKCQKDQRLTKQWVEQRRHSNVKLHLKYLMLAICNWKLKHMTNIILSDYYEELFM